jgi:hypothetical protein
MKHDMLGHFAFLLSLAEQDFETQTSGYHYVVSLDGQIKELSMISDSLTIDYCRSIELWLEANCIGSFLCFPEALGKYRCYGNSVFFKNPNDAILFRLSF